MILTAAQAREVGEALLDAAEKCLEKQQHQCVSVLGDVAVALPQDTLPDIGEPIAYVTP